MTNSQHFTHYITNNVPADNNIHHRLTQFKGEEGLERFLEDELRTFATHESDYTLWTSRDFSDLADFIDMIGVGQPDCTY